MKNSFELLNCDDHSYLLKKNNRDPGTCRPDIVHQCLLMLMDSPLNRANLLQVYIRTVKNVLIEINPQTRIPRTFRRFAGMMGELNVLLISPPTFRQHCNDSLSVQLLHKFCIRAGDTSLKLLKVIKNPITDHLPVGCKKVGFSFTGRFVSDCKTLVPEGDEPIAFVVGAFAHGVIQQDYTEDLISISKYPLSAALASTKLCSAFEEKWGIV